MNAPKEPEMGFQPEKEHQRQSIWQIYLPAVLGAAVFIGLCVWVVFYTAGYIPEPALPDQQTPAAKVAVIWLILPTCFGGLIQLALLGGTVFLLAKGIGGLPPAAHKVHAAIQRGSLWVRKVADKLAAPVIVVGSQKAGVDHFFDRILFWKHPSQGG